jgi:hypothetical protein
VASCAKVLSNFRFLRLLPVCKEGKMEPESGAVSTASRTPARGGGEEGLDCTGAL